MHKGLLAILLLTVLTGCDSPNRNNKQSMKKNPSTPFLWEAANMYFLLTDRFNNGDTSNDVNFERNRETKPLRTFMGGDIKGIIQKIEEGYFDDLGVNAIWFTPVVEQIHDGVDEGAGFTYGYHGYWAKDWTVLDPNFGTSDDLHKLVETAHAHGIRIVFDVVMNHTGPVTEKDPVWGEDWVRTGPMCTYDNFENTTSCTLVANLPDILTESNENVELPSFLTEKWKSENRYEKEMQELEAFFERTGYPRAPRFYIIKWLSDYVSEFGIDAFRVDTVKHTESEIWQELYDEASLAFENWKKTHPERVLADIPFFMVGEVYNYGINGGRMFDYGDKKVDFYEHGFKSLINFDMKYDSQKDYESLFSKYDSLLHNELKGKSVLNYLSSHDDGSPFDQHRERAYEAANKLLLTPGASQIYYGDETNRPLIIPGAEGDANLRSYMNWEDLQNNDSVKAIHEHWKKLGTFRKQHPAIGAGFHKKISDNPYVFSRILETDKLTDKVVVGLDLMQGAKSIPVGDIFPDGSKVTDHYSGMAITIKDGKAKLESPFRIVLLEKTEE
ncbi:alpha-amylase family glycosyl hydrolase [Robertkochia solimangrovi]|uniref:alpha-amylase family glycosyl hydrolase n=1 Tax=Robertkochia solimangrovi TaxID=2213046 RepID=UPI00117CDF35|nr:alpha-amylase family glycosyl hydrolase [Robertkochia solimangrovi]TRZ43642.1 alpha-amlyase [Robertkochia solimangrovi]